jgi:hypothetical protein
MVQHCRSIEPHNKPKAGGLTKLIGNSDTWLGAAAWERHLSPHKDIALVIEVFC